MLETFRRTRPISKQYYDDHNITNYNKYEWSKIIHEQQDLFGELHLNVISKRKRSLLGDIGKSLLSEAIKGFGAAIGVNLVTDVIKSAWEYLNPNSNTNRITRMEDYIHRTQGKFDLYEEIIDKLANATHNMAEKQRMLELKIRAFSHNDALYNHMADEIERSFESAIDATRNLISNKIQGIIALEALSQLTKNYDFFTIRL